MLIEPKSKNDKHNVEIAELGELEKAFKTILSYYYDGEDCTESEAANFEDTPVRAAKAMRDLLWPKKKIIAELEGILQTGFPMEPSEEEPGIVSQGPIRAVSYCPHHMLAVTYEVFVAYKPVKGGTVLGLSKLARVVQALAKRPVLQEQLARDIVDVLHYTEELAPLSEFDRSIMSRMTGTGEHLKYEENRLRSQHGMVPSNPHLPFPQIRSAGSAVQLLGRHSCMSCRGVKEDAVTVTTELRGRFKETKLKEEFEYAITSIRNTR